MTAKVFSGEIPISRLGVFYEQEIADGGIRDNLALDWYSSVSYSRDSSLAIISDAGATFDWSKANLQKQSASVWLSRLQRTIDIQMRRLSQMDKARLLSNEKASVGIRDWDVTLIDEQQDSALYMQPITRSVASRVAQLATDLTPLGPAETYAIIRLGYDLASERLRIYPFQDVEVDDGFWKDLFPEKITHMNMDSRYGTDKQSLEGAVKEERKPLIGGLLDAWKHLPIPIWKRIAYSLLLVLLVSLSVATIINFARPIVATIFQSQKPIVTHKTIVALSQTTEWGNVLKEVQGQQALLQTAYLGREGNVVSVMLLDCNKLLKLELPELVAKSLPVEVSRIGEIYLAIKGSLQSSDDVHTLVTNAELQELFNTLPTGWTQPKVDTTVLDPIDEQVLEQLIK
ncbi:hypothetical protein GCM10023156_34100 [Novipirellula rosea]|uniref:Uncharacterized protein n=2 Tax=Novipirellula rosea TaxID=1031540 RepID=A0ABP8MZ37_9BACT